MGMLGLATVLTEQGMEGIVPFVPPASARPKAAEPVVDVSADDASEISMGTWILVGVIVAVVMASALGYWISVKTAAPQRNKAAMTGSIKDLSSAPPRTVGRQLHPVPKPTRSPQWPPWHRSRSRRHPGRNHLP